MKPVWFEYSMDIDKCAEMTKYHVTVCGGSNVQNTLTQAVLYNFDMVLGIYRINLK